jgi:hypothetical protein
MRMLGQGVVQLHDPARAEASAGAPKLYDSDERSLNANRPIIPRIDA